LIRKPIEMNDATTPAAAALILALLACAPAAAQTPGAAASKPVKNVQVAAAAPAADAELLLRGCAGEAHRNAKLYVARAHGIELMKRSADRNQGRSMLRIEAQLDGTLTQLRGKSDGVDADLGRMEDALIGLTELTLQQPLVSQVEAALRLAERAATACDAAIGKVGYDAANHAMRMRQLALMLNTSQQLAGQFLAASLKPGGPTPAETALVQKLAKAFEAEFETLRAADDAQLREAVPMIAGQWLFMHQALRSPRDNARGKIEDVGRASELMFEVIDEQMQRLRRRA
jgi:hypothetical protein